MRGRRWMSALAAVLLAVGAALITGTASAAPAGVLVSDSLPAAAPSVAPANAGCGKNGPNRDTRTATSITAVQIRNGSSVNCQAVGAAQKGDRLDYYCYTVNADRTHTWTFLKDLRTGTIGWVRDDNLPVDGNGTHGSPVGCGF